jgi:hypothetical protein
MDASLHFIAFSMTKNDVFLSPTIQPLPHTDREQ